MLDGFFVTLAAIASGWVAANKIIYGDKLLSIPQNTIIGGLSHYSSNPSVTGFQPMCPSLGLMHCAQADVEKVSREGIQKLKQMME